MSQPFIGEIRLFAGNFAPRSWALCAGQLMSIAQNQALFSILGTTYGGDGQTTFGLPDLRGRVPLGWGQGAGLPNHTIGEISGAETSTLSSTQLPAHTHTASIGTLNIATASVAGNRRSPVDAIFATEAAGVTDVYSDGSANVTMAADALSGAPALANAGAGQPFGIVQPFLLINYIIALEGIFRSRN